MAVRWATGVYADYRRVRNAQATLGKLTGPGADTEPPRVGVASEGTVTPRAARGVVATGTATAAGGSGESDGLGTTEVWRALPLPLRVFFTPAPGFAFRGLLKACEGPAL